MKPELLSLKSKHTKLGLNLKHRKPNSSNDTSAFNDLVRRAMEVTLALKDMETSTARKLSADALVRETLAKINGTLKRVASLRSALENHEPGFDHSRPTLNRMIQFLRGPNAGFPPKEARRLNFLTTDATNGELAAQRYSSVELYCVAIQLAGERYPECFGTNENSAAWESRFAELTRQQCELFSKVGTALTADDLDIGKPDMKGHSMVSFKLSGGRVPIAPQDSAGERLVNYLIANGNDRP